MNAPVGDGILVHADGRPALRFERRYPQPVERVWRVVSDPDEMTRWFPSPVVGERTVGAELRFGDDASPVGGVVTACEPPRRFSFTWGGELLDLELTPDGAGTVLVFTHVLSHPSVGARNGAGWHMCFGALDQVLDDQVLDKPAPVPWSEVFGDYLERAGPPLGVPAPDGSMSWERATPVDADRLRAATSDPAEIAAWGGTGRAGDPVRWSSVPGPVGTVFTLTHTRMAGDPAGAAAWHALLIQLDMYLVSGRLVPVDPGRWVAAYAEIL